MIVVYRNQGYNPMTAAERTACAILEREESATGFYQLRSECAALFFDQETRVFIGKIEYSPIFMGTAIRIHWIIAVPGNGQRMLERFEHDMKVVNVISISLVSVVDQRESDDTVLRRFNFYQKTGYRFVGVRHVDLHIVEFEREKIL